MNTDDRRSLVHTWGWRPVLVLWGALLAGLMLFRLAFLLRFHGAFADSSAGAVLLGLVHGLRFDLSVVLAFTGLPALFVVLVSPLPLRRAWYWLLFAWTAAVGLAFAVLSAIDLNYYAYVARRVSFELVEMRNDWRPIVGIVLGGYPVQTAAVLLLLAAGLAGGAWGYGRLLARPRRRVRWWSHLALVALAFPLIVLGVRGGVQKKPLSVGMAFLGPDIAVAHLTLNPVFTAASALWRNKETHLDFLPEGEALRRTRDLLGLRGEPLDPRYPLLREQRPPGSAASGATPAAVGPEGSAPVAASVPAERRTRPRNLVILTVESLSAQFTGPLGGTEGLTPNFDRLAREGLLFSNFHASGTRSLEGIASILAGFPALPTHTLIDSAAEQTSVRGLPLILKERGYSAFFIHGAFRGSMWFDTFAERQGFDTYIGKEDFPDSDAISDSTWGVYDHHVVERLHEELEAARKPVLGFYFSLNPHTPFELPDESYRRFGPEHEQAGLYNSVAYADAALGRFFELARASDYWEDTVFAITADHHMGKWEMDARSRMWIPLLILSPGDPDFPRGVVDGTLGSQVDIAPTLLDVLGIGTTHAFAGTSLLRPAAERFALLGWGNRVGWLTPDWLLIHDIERPLALYDRARDPELRHSVLDRADAAPAVARDLQAYLQTLNNLLVDNRLSPNHPDAIAPRHKTAGVGTAVGTPASLTR